MSFDLLLKLGVIFNVDTRIPIVLAFFNHDLVSNGLPTVMETFDSLD